jgi:hypothetical protein
VADGKCEQERSPVPIHEEALAVLDALWNARYIRIDSARTALKNAGMSGLSKSFGKLPKRPSMPQAKRDFEYALHSHVY